jgi:diguanylate cyclase (GGDEF)-like protein
MVRAVWARGSTEPFAITAGYESPLEGSSLERILATREPRVLHDLEEYLGRHPDSDSTRRIVEEGMRSSLTVPLVALGRAVGFLFFSSRRARAYSEEHVRLLRQVAGEVSHILEKSRLYDELLETKVQLERANTTLTRLAAEDPLTGVANRRVFDQRLDEEWRRAQRAQGSLAVLMIDVDEFKAFNDRNGHAAGDRCLVEVATALASNLRRAGDLLSRYGGEEFAAILPETTVAAASRIAEVLRCAVEALREPHGGSPVAPHVTVSIGAAAVYPAAGGDAAALVAAADAALYQAKAAGRNTCRSRELTGEISVVNA